MTIMTINTSKVWVFNETKHIMGLFLTEIYRVAQVVQEPEVEQVYLKKKILLNITFSHVHCVMVVLTRLQLYSHFDDQIYCLTGWFV